MHTHTCIRGFCRDLNPALYQALIKDYYTCLSCLICLGGNSFLLMSRHVCELHTIYLLRSFDA